MNIRRDMLRLRDECRQNLGTYTKMEIENSGKNPASFQSVFYIARRKDAA